MDHGSSETEDEEKKIHGGHKNKPMLFEEDCKENKKFSPKM